MPALSIRLPPFVYPEVCYRDKQFTNQGNEPKLERVYGVMMMMMLVHYEHDSRAPWKMSLGPLVLKEEG